MNSFFLKTNIFVLVISNSGIFFGYLYQVLMGRYLSVGDFGILTSVNSLGIISGSIFGVIPFIVSKYIIELHADKDLKILLLWKVFKITLLILIVIVVSIFLMINSITQYLKLPNSLPIYLFLLFLITGVILSIFLGVMQGMLMHVRLSLKVALVKLLQLIFAIFIVVFMGYSYNGALVAATLANFTIGVWVYFLIREYVPLKRIVHKKLPHKISKEIMTYAVPVALTLFVMVVVTNIDVVLVKHYADDVAAGEYSVGAVISRVAVFVPGVLLTVLFPQVSQNSADGKSSIVTLAVVMGLTILLSGSLLLIILFFPEFIIKLFFGEKYIAASEVLVIISLAMSVVAVLGVIFNFLLAKRMYAFLYVSYAILFVSGGYIYAVDSFEVIELIYVILYTCLLLLILNSLLLVFYWRKGLYSNAG